MKLHLKVLVEENNKLYELGMETRRQIVYNWRRLINDLPPNSPYCKPLLAYLMDGLEKYKTLEVFQISARTYGRIQQKTRNSLVETKYSVGVTRVRVTEEQLEEVYRILDDILPKQVKEIGELKK